MFIDTGFHKLLDLSGKGLLAVIDQAIARVELRASERNVFTAALFICSLQRAAFVCVRKDGAGLCKEFCDE
ncbi:MAG: hypothetical protein Q7T48_11895 [Cellvibrio sp.]|uniref:hypothetical protein n=1 Tax=Cellvibrio sp. TaxID=1965322 RepID=UPI00271F5186|nr:hypothetical protein [Cellvibrio sp.]